jgi:alanine racemase
MNGPNSAFPGRVVVDLDAIRENIDSLHQAAGGAQVMAVVKANAYGHGLVPVARAAVQGGATWLGTAQLAEAMRLRSAAPDLAQVPLLAWLYAPQTDFGAAIGAGIDIGVSSIGSLERIAAADARTPARIHLKVDTGLGRAGTSPQAWGPLGNWEALLDRALKLEAQGVVRAVGIWSHFAYADEPGHPTIASQIEVFKAALDLAERRGASFEVRHLANSAALVSGLDVNFDMVRPGLAVYGLSPIAPEASANGPVLRPAMTLEADLTLIKSLPADHGLSYGHTYHTSGPTITGIVPLGYADGVPREYSGRGPVWTEGYRTSIAGRVCMDQFVIDLGPDSTASEGQTVVLFGPGDRGEPTAQDWADITGGIVYEVVTRIPDHVPRVYRGERDAGA